MSVEFYGCDSCGESRYEEFVSECYKCGHSLCTRCLVNKDFESDYAYHYGVKFDGTQTMADEYGIEIGDYEDGEIIDDTGIDPKYCPFCNGKEVHNDELLKYALDKLSMSREELITSYRENRL